MIPKVPVILLHKCWASPLHNMSSSALSCLYWLWSRHFLVKIRRCFLHNKCRYLRASPSISVLRKRRKHDLAQLSVSTLFIFLIFRPYSVLTEYHSSNARFPSASQPNKTRHFILQVLLSLSVVHKASVSVPQKSPLSHSLPLFRPSLSPFAVFMEKKLLLYERPELAPPNWSTNALV